MDERLNEAPCGYLALTEEHVIVEINDTLLKLLGYSREGLTGCQFDSLLTRSSRVLYQIYFFPLIKLNGRLDEMYLSLRTVDGVELHCLLNAARRERSGHIYHDCILIPMKRRREYEEYVAAAEKAAKDAAERYKLLQRALTDKVNEFEALQRQAEALRARLRLDEQ